MKQLISFVILSGGIAITAISGGTAHGGFDVSGTSDGYGLSSNLNLTLLSTLQVAANVSPVGESTGTAPNPYNQTMSAVTLNVTAGTYLVVGHVLAATGVIDSQANSDVDGTVGNRLAHGTSTINNLNLQTITTLGTGLVGVTAGTIISNSNTTGTYGALSSNGSTVVTNLHITLLGVDLNLGVSANGSIVANTGVNLGASTLVGVSILLNEQIVSGDGVFSSQITTNAIHIHFNATVVAGIGTLNGDVIIGHSSSQITAVPEPSSLALVGMGFTGLIWKVRRRVKSKVS